MPIVTCYCHTDNGETPEVYVRIDGNFYRTGIHLSYMYSYRSGWVSSSPMLLSGHLTCESRAKLKGIIKIMINNPEKEQFALPRGDLVYCGLRFVL